MNLDNTLKAFSKNIFLATFLLSFLFFTQTAFAESGISFINRSIWYVPDPFYVGQTVRVYAGILNTSEYDTKGTAHFYANGKLIGSADFAVRGSGNIQVIWADWMATHGEVSFSVRVEKVFSSVPGKPDMPVNIDSANASISFYVNNAPTPPAPTDNGNNKGSTTGNASENTIENNRGSAIKNIENLNNSGSSVNQPSGSFSIGKVSSTASTSRPTNSSTTSKSTSGVMEFFNKNIKNNSNSPLGALINGISSVVGMVGSGIDSVANFFQQKVIAWQNSLKGEITKRALALQENGSSNNQNYLDKFTNFFKGTAGLAGLVFGLSGVIWLLGNEIARYVMAGILLVGVIRLIFFIIKKITGE